jgi:hypothetical protein
MARGVGVRAAAGLAAAVLLATAAGCGDDADAGDDPRELARVETAIGQVQRAFAAERYARVCELVTPAASRHVGLGAHGRGASCLDSMDRLSGWVRGVRSRLEPPAPKVVSVDVDDDDDTRATARLRFGDGRTSVVPMRKLSGRWKLDAFYGGVPADQQESKF